MLIAILMVVGIWTVTSTTSWILLRKGPRHVNGLSFIIYTLFITAVIVVIVGTVDRSWVGDIFGMVVALILLEFLNPRFFALATLIIGSPPWTDEVTVE